MVFNPLLANVNMVMAAGAKAESVATWEALEQAINANTNAEITINADLAANKTITIPSGKTITLKGDKTIYRASSFDDPAKFLSMFKVENGGTLNVEGNLKLSGKTAALFENQKTASIEVQKYAANVGLPLGDGDTKEDPFIITPENFDGNNLKSGYKVAFKITNTGSEALKDVKLKDEYLTNNEGYVDHYTCETRPEIIQQGNFGGEVKNFDLAVGEEIIILAELSNFYLDSVIHADKVTVTGVGATSGETATSSDAWYAKPGEEVKVKLIPVTYDMSSRSDLSSRKYLLRNKDKQEVITAKQDSEEIVRDFNADIKFDGTPMSQSLLKNATFTANIYGYLTLEKNPEDRDNATKKYYYRLRNDATGRNLAARNADKLNPSFTTALYDCFLVDDTEVERFETFAVNPLDRRGTVAFTNATEFTNDYTVASNDIIFAQNDGQITGKPSATRDLNENGLKTRNYRYMRWNNKFNIFTAYAARSLDATTQDVPQLYEVVEVPTVKSLKAITENEATPETKTTYSIKKVTYNMDLLSGTESPTDYNDKSYLLVDSKDNKIITAQADNQELIEKSYDVALDGTEFDSQKIVELKNAIFDAAYAGKAKQTAFYTFTNRTGTGRILGVSKDRWNPIKGYTSTNILSDSTISLPLTWHTNGADIDGETYTNQLMFWYSQNNTSSELANNGEFKYLGIYNKDDTLWARGNVVENDRKYRGIQLYELVKHETEVPSQNTDKVVDPNSIEDAIFNAEDLGNPEKGGFFIHNEGGTVTVNGAVFKDMTITSGEDSPKNITPIYNNAGHFTMTAGSIENNKLDDFSDLDSTVTGRELNAQIKKHPVNNNTGAIVFENGAIGNISGGTITNNKGMIGAIKVDASELNLTGSTKITHNEGSIYTGAIFIDHEGKGVTMDGKDVEIANNLSWRNGAVFTHLHPKDTFTPNPDGTAKIGGRFTLNAGTIHDNTSYDKGGAIRIKSNGVSLNGGEIYNNTSRVMGGAIYVDGDSPKRSRTLKLENGAIYGNKALGKDASELGGDTDVAFPKGDADGRPGYLQSGCGGGVWTCPFGTLVFNGETVNIGENSAKREGQDFHKDNGLSGAVILSNMPRTWKNEAGGELPSQAKPIDGVVNLTNNGSVDKNVTGVKIYNNTSRRGGGVAANGTLIFGKTEKETRNQAVLNFTKAWAEGTPPKENVTFKFTIVAEDGTKTELGEYTITAATSTGNSELDTFEQIAPWKVQIMLPNSYATKDGEKSFYDTTLEKGATIKKADWKLQAEEVNTGEKYTVDYSDVTLANKETLENVSEMTDKSGNHLKTTIIFNKFTFAQTATNTKEEQLAPATLTLQATKVLNGAEITSDQYKNAFQFKLTQTEGETIALPSDGVVTNDGDKINFGTLTFEKAGTYQFKYEELQDNKIEGITYDDKVDTFTVKVQKIDGKLVATNNKEKPFENATFALRTITNTYEPGKHNISISKVDIAGKELPGAHIQIKDNNGTVIEDWTSTATAKVIKLTEGSYTFHEEAAPNGYLKVTDITFEITKDGKVTNVVVQNDDKAEASESTLTVTDEAEPEKPVVPEKHDITISKVDIAGKELPGAHIQIKDNNGTVIEDWTSTATAKVIKLTEGSYTFHEEAAPNGYLKVTDITFEITKDGKVTNVVVQNDDKAEASESTLTVTDEAEPEKPVVPEKHDITISKVDIAGKELPGAHIQIKDNNGTVIEDWTSTATAKVIKLTEGSYTFHEEAAPNGYLKVTDITFEITKDGKVTNVVVQNDDKAEASESTLTVTDEAEPEKPVVPEKHDITISKVDIAGKELPGAHIQIKDNNGTVIEDWTSTATAKVIKLTEGSYTFHEEAAPNGYLKVTDITFEITKDGKVTNVVVQNDDKAEASESTLTVTDKAEPEKPVVPEKHDITISKVDIAGKELPGAHIQIKDNNGTVIEDWTSTATAKVIKLTEGSYTFHEEAAPNGYLKVTDITFEITKDGKVTNVVVQNDDKAEASESTLTVTDKAEPEKPAVPEKHDITISKVDIAGKELPGAHIQIKDNNGTVIEDWTSTATAKVIKLTEGSYTFHEEAAPNGYLKVTDITFEITKDGKVTNVVVQNDDKAEASESTLTVTDEAEPEKPTYKDGTLATTVNVGGQTGSKDKAATIEINEDTVTTNVTDTIDYKDLFVGVEYQVTGKLMDLTTNKQVATATTTFTPQVATGTTSITFEGVTLTAGHKYVVFEYAKTTTDIEFVDGNKPHTAEHADPSDKAQTIVVNKEEPVTPEPEKPTYKDGTLATTVNVGGQTGSKDKAATIEINEDTVTTNVTDTIDYKDLFVGVEYQVTGKLMDLTTNKQVATATTTFTPQVATGTTSITFEGVTLTAGHKYVVFEYAKTTTDIEFVDGNKPHTAEHADPSDKAQTIVVNKEEPVTPEPEKPTYKDGALATTVNVGDVTGSKDKAATIVISEDTVTTNVTDTIDYKDFFAGVEYKVTGKLMDITDINNPVEVATATTTFTPQTANGSTSITFEGVTVMAGHKYVAFEYAESTTNIEFVDGNKPHKAEHADPSDKAQTIVVNKEVPEKPVTPEKPVVPEKPVTPEQPDNGGGNPNGPNNNGPATGNPEDGGGRPNNGLGLPTTGAAKSYSVFAGLMSLVGGVFILVARMKKFRK